MATAKKKAKKAAKVKDLKPAKDAKGGRKAGGAQPESAANRPRYNVN